MLLCIATFVASGRFSVGPLPFRRNRLLDFFPLFPHCVRRTTSAQAQGAIARRCRQTGVAAGHRDRLAEGARSTITEYASMSCPHCAAWGENVFPMLRSRYIDTGKVRFVFREFPLDLKAAGASMLARCIARDDSEKYLA